MHLERVSPAAEVIGRKVLEVDASSGVVRLAFLARPEFHSEGELSDPDGNAVARATAVFRIVRRR